MEYDKILMDIGGLSRAQLLLFVLLSFTNFKACLEFQLLALFTHTPPYECVMHNVSSVAIGSDNCTVLMTDNSTSRCTQFRFLDSAFTKSLTSQYELVCDRTYLRDLLTPIYFAGTALGMILGTLGDIYGRKRVIVIMLLLDAVTSPLPTFFVSSFTFQLATRFLKGVSSAVYYQSLLLVEELTAEQYRSVLGNLFWLFWCAGYMVSGPTVALLQDWRVIQLVTMAPCAVYGLIAWLVPESPRWLVLRGRQSEAVKVFQRIADWNGIQLPAGYFAGCVDIHREPTGKLLHLFSFVQMRKKSMVVFLMLTTFSFTYCGLSADVEFTTPNIILNQVFTGLVEIPSSFIAWLLSDRVGRRDPTIVMSILSGLCVMAVPHLSDGWYRTAIALFAKCILTAAYCIMDLYATELLPTSVRNNGLFLATFLATLANIVAPYTNSLSRVALYLPGLVYGCMTICSSLTLLLLPETRGLPLPDTVPHAEAMVRGREPQWRLEQLRREKGLGEREGDGGDAKEEKGVSLREGQGLNAISITSGSI